MLVTTPYGEQIKVVLFPDEENKFVMHMRWNTDTGSLHYTLRLTRSFTLAVQTKVEDLIVTRLAERGLLQTMLWLEEPLELVEEIKSVDHKEMK